MAISNTKDYQRVEGTEGNDLIKNSGFYTTIDGGAGNDTIDNSGSYNNMYVTIDGGAGNDIITSDAYYVTINGGDGNDTITDKVASYGSTIRGGKGNDSIYSWYRTTLNADEGDDNIRAIAGSIAGGDGNDSIRLDGRYDGVTVNGGKGNEYITVNNDSAYYYGRLYLYKNGYGNDTITSVEWIDTVQVADGSEYTTVATGANKQDMLIKVGNGSILIKDGANVNFTLTNATIASEEFVPAAINIVNTSDKVSVLGTKLNDTIENHGENVTVLGGADADIISNWAERSILNGEAGADQIQNEASSVTANGGAGNDLIYNNRETQSEEVLFDGGAGDDTITNFAINSTLIGGDGNDLIYNHADNAIVDAGAGNDTVYNYGDGSDINGSSDNDRIINRADSAVINGNAGDDHITNYGSGNVLNGGDGADTIEDFGSDNTITGGAGNDYIYAGTSSAIVYNVGDGNDTIAGFGLDDKLIINGDYTVTTSDANKVIKMSDGAEIVLENAGAYDFIKDSVTGALTIDTTPPEPIPEPETIDTATEQTYTYEVQSNKERVDVTELSYADVDVGSSTEKIYTDDFPVHLVIQNGNDHTGVTMEGGILSDTFEGGESVGEVFRFDVRTGIGNDVINNFDANDTLSLQKNTFSSAYVSGDDYVVIVKSGNTSSGSITLKDAAKFANNFKWNANNTSMILDGVTTLTNHTNKFYFEGSNARDCLVNSGNNVTINAKGGDDTIIASDNAERFQVGAINGNDVIDGFGKGDTLEVTNGSIQSIEQSDNDVIVTVKDSKNTASITLVDAAELELKQNGQYLTVDSIETIVNRDAGEKVIGTSGRDYILNGGANAIIDAKGGNDTIEGSNLGEVFLVAKNYGNDVVLNFGKNDSINVTSGSSKTVVSGDDVIVSVEGGATMTLKDAAQYQLIKSGNYWKVDAPNLIENDKDNEKVTGTTGKDYIVNTGENVTIQAGAGADTIEGSTEYGEMFLFSADSGNDVITNFWIGDSLKATGGTISAVETVNNNRDLVVSIKGSKNTGKVTLQGAAGGANGIKQVGNTIFFDNINNIVNHEDKKKITGSTIGSNNDYIINSGENVTIQAGKGDDTIEGSTEYGETYLFNYESGNDVITNFDEKDTLRSTDGNITSVDTIGNDVLVTITKGQKSGTILLKDAASLSLKQSGKTITVDSIPVIDNTEDKKRITGTAKAEIITNTGENVTIQAGPGNDTMTGSDEFGDLFMVSYASGDDVITNFGKGDTLQITSAKSISVVPSDNDLIVSMTKGNTTGTVTLQNVDPTKIRKEGNKLIFASGETIDNATPDIVVEGTDYDDVISNTADNVTIRGKGGDDTIEGSTYGEVFEFNAIDGNDVITNFSVGDVVRVALGKVMTAAKSGNDFVITVHDERSGNTGRLTLQGVGDKVVQSGKYFMIHGSASIINHSNNTTVAGTEFNDHITNSGSNVVINGKGGNDTISLSDNPERVQFASDGGQDLVQGFGAEDTLQIIGGAISSRRRVGDDYVVDVKSNIYSGSITLEGAGALNFVESNDVGGQYLTADEIQYKINYKDDFKVKGTKAREYFFNTGDNVSIATGTGNDTIEGSNKAEMFLTAQKQGDDIIINFGADDTLKVTGGTVASHGANGDDYVVSIKGGGSMTLKNMASAGIKYNSSQKAFTMGGVNYVNNADDKKKIIGNNANSGTDYIVNTGENVTIQPGLGNDTMDGSDTYGEVFLVSHASGDDVIVNFGKDDTLKSTKGTMSYKAVDNDVLVTVTKGKTNGTVLLKDAAMLDLNLKNNALTVNTVNEIINVNDNFKVTGSTKADYIVNTGENVSIQAGKGNDTIDGSIFGETFLFSYAEGNNVITNFGANDTIRSTSGTMTYATNGNDVIVSIKKGSTTGKTTLQGAAAYNFKQEGNALYVSDWNKISNTEDGKKITGTTGKDYVVNTGEHVTIQTGKGNDLLTGSDSYGELFQFGYASGDDTITNFGLGDTLQSTSGTLSFEKSGNDYIVSIKKDGQKAVGTITLQDAVTNYTLQQSGKNIIARPQSGSTTAKQVPDEQGIYWFLDDETAIDPIDNEVTTMMTEFDSDNSIGKLDYASDPSELLTNIDSTNKLEQSMALNARNKARK